MRKGINIDKRNSKKWYGISTYLQNILEFFLTYEKGKPNNDIKNFTNRYVYNCYFYVFTTIGSE